jgi:hypothetical protein
MTASSGRLFVIANGTILAMCILSSCARQEEAPSPPGSRWAVTHTSYIGAAAVEVGSIMPSGHHVRFSLAAYERPESELPPQRIAGGVRGPVGIIDAVVDCESKLLSIGAMSFINEAGETTAQVPDAEVRPLRPLMKGDGSQPYDHAVDLVCTENGRAELQQMEAVSRSQLVRTLRHAVETY